MRAKALTRRQLRNHRKGFASSRSCFASARLPALSNFLEDVETALFCSNGTLQPEEEAAFRSVSIIVEQALRAFFWGGGRSRLTGRWAQSPKRTLFNAFKRNGPYIGQSKATLFFVEIWKAASPKSEQNRRLTEPRGLF